MFLGEGKRGLPVFQIAKGWNKVKFLSEKEKHNWMDAERLPRRHLLQALLPAFPSKA